MLYVAVTGPRPSTSLRVLQTSAALRSAGTLDCFIVCFDDHQVVGVSDRYQPTAHTVRSEQMNVCGKVLAVMVVLAGLASTVLTAKLIAVRNSWTAKNQAFVKSYADTARQTREAAEQRQLVLHELERMNREWGTDFRAAGGVQTQLLNPADGKLEVQLGMGAGLQEKQLVHGFEIKGDGTSVYRGPYVVFGPPQAERSAMQPAWRIRPGEPAEWQAGRWRWRSSIPSGYSQQFDKLMGDFTRADEVLADRTASMAIQDELIAEASVALERRQAELVGGDQLPKDENIPPEFRLGLVSTLESTEEERNSVLLEIDELRRQVRQARDAVVQLQQQNLALTQKLPAGNGYSN